MEAGGIRSGAGHVRQLAMPGDSAAVEAGRKTTVGQRLKLSGMHWTVAGADATISLRCREASSQWETICKQPRTQTGAA